MRAALGSVPARPASLDGLDAPARQRARAAAARRRRAGRRSPSSGTGVRGARGAEEAARAGIARMRFAVGIDDDLAEFHARFRDDPVIGRAVRARPWLRVRRNPDPWETLAWAITEQLIDMRARDRDPEAHDRRVRAARRAGCATRRRAATIAALRARRARGLRAGTPSARWRCAAPRARSRPAASSLRRRLAARLLAIPEIGTWTVEMLALHGLGRLDVVPAGDLGYLKLVGRLTHGQPARDRRRGRGARVLRALRAVGRARRPVPDLSRARTLPGPRRAGTRWSAAAPPKAAA